MPVLPRRSHATGLRLATFLLVWTFAACGGGGTTPPTIASITLDPTTATLTFTGQVLTILAVVRDTEGNTVAATPQWSSSAPGVATVDATGTVTAAGVGTATITATTSGVSASTTVTVDLRAATVSISPSGSTVDVGASVTLTATVEDGSGAPIPDPVIDWSSSNPGVASVSAAGVVTGVSGGSATITARVDDVSGTAAITVNPGSASGTIPPRIRSN